MAGGTISNSTGAGVLVNGGTPNAIINAAIQTNPNYSIEVENVAATSNVAFGGTVTDTGKGLLVQNNTGGSVTFNGAMTLTTGANDAVTLTNNTGAAIAFNGTSNITTTTGQGFVASGGGTIGGTGTNTITTGATTGAALNLNGVAIAANGLAFQSVTAAGAGNGVLLTNISGGSLTVAGGSISNSTGAGVLCHRRHAQRHHQRHDSEQSQLLGRGRRRGRDKQRHVSVAPSPTPARAFWCKTTPAAA